MILNNKGVSNAVVAIILVVVVAISATALIAYLYFNNNSDSSVSDQSNNSSSTNNNVGLKAEPPYRLTISVTDTANPEYASSSTIDYQSDKSWKIVSNSNGQSAEMIYLDGYMYSGQNGQWFKIKADDSNDNSTQIDAYTLSDDQINDYQNNANQITEEQCASGVCQVYELTKTIDGVDESAKLYVDKDSKNVVKIVTVNGTQTSTVEYDFDAQFEITPPANYQEFNNPAAN